MEAASEKTVHGEPLPALPRHHHHGTNSPLVRVREKLVWGRAGRGGAEMLRGRKNQVLCPRRYVVGFDWRARLRRIVALDSALDEMWGKSKLTSGASSGVGISRLVASCADEGSSDLLCFCGSLAERGEFFRVLAPAKAVKHVERRDS